jgi:hypothetical protein
MNINQKSYISASLILFALFTGLFCNNVTANNYVSVTDYGATGDGSTNDGPAFQSAHDALGADGGTIFVPATGVNYLISSAVTFTKPVRLLGEGWYGSDILTRTGNIAVFSTNKKLDVENMTFTALDSAQTTATFVFVQSTAAGHNHSTLRNCYFLYGKYSYATESANAFNVDDCQFSGYATAGLYLTNPNPDCGDSFIVNNTFSSNAGGIGIVAPSTSGLYIANNKFLNEVGHILISPDANVVGDFLISNNSFEGHSDYAIKLIATTGSVSKTVITGNQFSSDSDYHIVLGNNALNTMIQGNIFNSTSALLTTAISIEAGAKNVTINGNAFHQILKGVVADQNTNVGITMDGNRFANDVTTLFSGEAGCNYYSSDKKITFTRLIVNYSDTTYVNAVKVIGRTVLEVKIYGLVQGVNYSSYYTKKLISGTTISDIIAPVKVGANFDVQVAAYGGNGVAVGIKRAPGIGTYLTMYVIVAVDGYVTDFSAL